MIAPQTDSMYIIIVSIFGTLGIAMMFQIIKYLKSKPLGFQTLMDSLYIQLIQYWILESSLTFVTIILIQIQENNWILAWLVGFGTYLAMLLSSIHLLICLIFQILLIWYQSIFDPFEDGKILKYIRYKFKILGLCIKITSLWKSHFSGFLKLDSSQPLELFYLFLQMFQN